MSKYYKCKCGSEMFIRVFNVLNEKIKVEVTKEGDKEFWDAEEHGREKDHLVGYICADCRKDAQELNDGLF